MSDDKHAPATPPLGGNPAARGPVPPMRTQPAFQPFAPAPQGPQAAPGRMPPTGPGAVPPANTPGGPGAPAVPVMTLGGVPFTIICPEGYLPVIKFIKIPERTPRPEEMPGGAAGSGAGAPAAPSPSGAGR